MFSFYSGNEALVYVFMAFEAIRDAVSNSCDFPQYRSYFNDSIMPIKDNFFKA